MRRHGLRAIQPRAYTPCTTDSTHGLRCALNRLLDQPKLTQANQLWVSNIKCLSLASGQGAYLCACQDACTRQVVGWRVLDTLSEKLATSALCPALLARQPAQGLLVHSNCGGQDCGSAYRALLAQPGCLRLQSRRDACLDNAQAENRLKVFVPVVTAQNPGVGAARVARLPRPGGRAAARSRLFRLLQSRVPTLDARLPDSTSLLFPII